MFSLVCLAYWFLFAPDTLRLWVPCRRIGTRDAISVFYSCPRIRVYYSHGFLKATVGLALFILAVRMINEIDTSLSLARWPAIEAKAVPRATCPDFLGFWPMYKCIVGSQVCQNSKLRSTMMKLSVVVPCYNERHTICQLA